MRDLLHMVTLFLLDFDDKVLIQIHLVRPPSALSSLRFMTPISPVQSNSRLTLVRANTDHGSLSPSKDSRTLPGPPLPSPRLLDPSARSESDPGDYLDVN